MRVARGPRLQGPHVEAPGELAIAVRIHVVGTVVADQPFGRIGWKLDRPPVLFPAIPCRPALAPSQVEAGASGHVHRRRRSRGRLGGLVRSRLLPGIGIARNGRNSRGDSAAIAAISWIPSRAGRVGSPPSRSSISTWRKSSSPIAPAEDRTQETVRLALVESVIRSIRSRHCPMCPANGGKLKRHLGRNRLKLKLERPGT